MRIEKAANDWAPINIIIRKKEEYFAKCGKERFTWMLYLDSLLSMRPRGLRWDVRGLYPEDRIPLFNRIFERRLLFDDIPMRHS